jgi:hypothetical protein
VSFASVTALLQRDAAAGGGGVNRVAFLINGDFYALKIIRSLYLIALFGNSFRGFWSAAIEADSPNQTHNPVIAGFRYFARSLSGCEIRVCLPLNLQVAVVENHVSAAKAHAWKH